MTIVLSQDSTLHPSLFWNSGELANIVRDFKTSCLLAAELDASTRCISSHLLRMTSFGLTTVETC